MDLIMSLHVEKRTPISKWTSAHVSDMVQDVLGKKHKFLASSSLFDGKKMLNATDKELRKFFSDDESKCQ